MLPLIFLGTFSAAGQSDHLRDSLSKANTPHAIEVGPKKQWDFEGIHYSNQFDGARLGWVEMTNTNEFMVSIGPENTPINGSPWYAFKVWADEPMAISVTLNYLEFYHRYHPKISEDGKHWEWLDDDLVHFPSNVHYHPGQTGDTIQLYPTVQLGLNVGPDTLWVAAQEVITSDDSEVWWSKMIKQLGDDVEFHRGSDSCALFHSVIGSGPNTLLLLGRQHPPEVTGSKALRHFFQRLVDDDSLAVAFRSQWTVVVLPMMNPDGVDMGNWRHNADGVDLNRDWWLVQHRETQCAQRILRPHIEHSQQALMIDFHSTWKDIFYLQEPAPFNQVIDRWLDRIEHSFMEPTPRKVAPVALPVTSMHWAARHEVPAVVYEVGDDTPPAHLHRKAQTSAEALMEVLLMGQ